MSLDTALKEDKLPSFNNPASRGAGAANPAKRVFLISTKTNSRRACVDPIRDRWEKFWTYPEVGEALAKWTERQAEDPRLGSIIREIVAACKGDQERHK